MTEEPSLTEKREVFLNQFAEEIPFVELPGAGKWTASYETGHALERIFPGQGGYDLMSMMEYNGRPVGVGDLTLTRLLMLVEGERDEASWHWIVQFQGTDITRNFFVTGGCDYTGWDCQSWSSWYELLDDGPHETILETDD